MSDSQFFVYQCPYCRLRFPFAGSSVIRCPHCRGDVAPLTAYPNPKVVADLPRPPGPPVEALLDNIRSAFNVGSMFRASDGAGVRQMHLCGITTTPDQPKLAKTALSTEQNLPWKHYPNCLDPLPAFQQAGYRLWALEGGEKAVSLFELKKELAGPPIVLIAGSELAGVDPDLLAACEHVVSIPMQGPKRSLNVAVAFSIAAYYLRFGGW